MEKKNVEGKYLEKEKIFFVEEKKNGEGKGGKYLERENVTMAGQTTNNERSSYSSNGLWKAAEDRTEDRTEARTGQRTEQGAGQRTGISDLTTFLTISDHFRKSFP